MQLSQIPAHWATPILRRGLWIFVFAVLLVLWVLVLSFSYAYRSRLIEASTSELVQLNSVVAQHTFALFRSVETDLKVIDRWLQNYRGKDPLNDASFVALIDDLRKLSGNLIDMRIITADGKPISFLTPITLCVRMSPTAPISALTRATARRPCTSEIPY